MVNQKSKKQVEDINRRVYGSKTITKLKDIAKNKHGLLNVDHYTNTNKKELIERIVKGKQLTDEPKNVLLEQAKNAGLKVNVSMSKETIIKTLTSPKLTDYTKDKLIEAANKKGVPLPSQITGKRIIERLKNPDAFYTVVSLKRLLKNNNIDTKGINDKPNLINLAEERGLITTTPIKPQEIQEANLWVSVKNIPEALRRVVKKKARNAREAVADFKDYIKNLNKDYLTPSRLKKLSRQLEKKEKKAEEEKQRIFKPIKEKSAFNNFAVQYVIINTDPTYDPITFLYNSGPPMINIMNTNRNIKVKLYLNCLMKRADPAGTIIKKFAFHSIGQKIITESTDPHEIYKEMIDEIEEEINKIEQAEGSGWVFVEVESLALHADKWSPINGSSYIDLPKELKNRKAIINMKNEDNKCFLWCVLRVLNPKDRDAERIDKDLKSKENTLNMEGIPYPVEFKDINRFEKQNPDISISILGYSKDERVYPLRISKYTKSKKEDERKHNIILLLIKNGENSHYCIVKNLSALLSTQINKHGHKLYFCLNCLNSYDCPEKLEHHKEYCSEKENIKINMPPPGSFLKFNNFLYSEKAPFAIYADFESLIKPLDNCEPNPNISFTNKYQKTRTGKLYLLYQKL